MLACYTYSLLFAYVKSLNIVIVIVYLNFYDLTSYSMVFMLNYVWTNNHNVHPHVSYILTSLCSCRVWVSSNILDYRV